MIDKNTNLIIGDIDSGKTTKELLPKIKEIIENNENILFLDNKLEYYGTYAEKLKELGYDIKVLNLKDTTKTNGFNPLSLPYYFYKQGDKDKSYKLINNIAKEIFREEDNSALFWVNAATQYFIGLVLILFKEGKEEEINLGSVGAMISLGENKIDDTFVTKKYLNNLAVIDPIYISLSSTVFSPAETRMSVLSVVRSKMNVFLMRENLLKSLCKNDICLENLKNKTAIFIIGEKNTNNFAGILIDELIELCIYKNISYTFILDNFESLPKFEEMESLINEATYNNFKVYVSVRNKEEIESKYKNIINNFKALITDFENKKIMNVGTYNILPELSLEKIKYFDFEKFVKENIN